MIVNDSFDNLDTLGDDKEINSAEMFKTIKQLFSTNQDSVNEKVDNLNSDITKRFTDVELTEHKHHAESTAAQQRAEEKITHRLEALEKVNNKRSSELEKKIDQTN